MMARISASFLAGLIVAGAGLASVQSRAPLTRTDSERYALIVWAESDLGAPRLADVLEERYGYRVLRQPDPSRDSILQAFEEIYDRISEASSARTYTELVVYLSLPTFRDPHLFLVPPGGQPSKPWTLLNSGELFEWLNALPAGASLVFYPTCAPTRSQYGDPELQELTYSKRPGTLEMALICASGLRGQALMRQERVEDETQSVLWRSDELADALALTLEEAAIDGALEIPALELLDNSAEEIGLLGARIQPIPLYQGSSFRFVPVRKATGYRARYGAATSLGELEELLESFVASREDAALVDLLRDVALDRQALAPNAGLADSKALGLRIWSLETLGGIDSIAGKNALGAVIGGASDSAVVRRRALASLTRQGEPRPQDLEVIRQAAQDPDTSVREAAVRALTAAKDEAAADLFAELLTEEDDPNLRLALIQGLSGFARSQDRQVFVHILETGGVAERREAISAIGRLAPDEQSSGALLMALHDADDSVRQAAAYSLGRTWLPGVRRAVVDGLIDSLEHDTDQVAAAAASSLGRIGGADSEEILRFTVGQWLEGEQQTERVAIAAIEALGRMQSEPAIQEIEHAASHPSPGIRRAAVSALGAIGGDRATEILISTLDDRDPYVRGVAERELEAVEASAKQATLERNVDNSSPIVRLTIVKELRGRTDEEAIDSLVELLSDDDFDVRSAAADALSDREDLQTAEKIAALFERGNAGAREAAAVVLGSMPIADDGLLVRALAGAAEDRVDGVRAAAVRGLGTRSDERTVELILKATKDRSEEVRLAAAEALGSFLSPDVEAHLQYMATEDPSHLVRRAAVSSLSGGEMAY